MRQEDQFLSQCFVEVQDNIAINKEMSTLMMAKIMMNEQCLQKKSQILDKNKERPCEDNRIILWRSTNCYLIPQLRIVGQISSKQSVLYSFQQIKICNRVFSNRFQNQFSYGFTGGGLGNSPPVSIYYIDAKQVRNGKS